MVERWNGVGWRAAELRGEVEGVGVDPCMPGRSFMRRLVSTLSNMRADTRVCPYIGQLVIQASLV